MRDNSPLVNAHGLSRKNQSTPNKTAKALARHFDADHSPQEDDDFGLGNLVIDLDASACSQQSESPTKSESDRMESKVYDDDTDQGQSSPTTRTAAEHESSAVAADKGLKMKIKRKSAGPGGMKVENVKHEIVRSNEDKDNCNNVKVNSNSNDKSNKPNEKTVKGRRKENRSKTTNKNNNPSDRNNHLNGDSEDLELSNKRPKVEKVDATTDTCSVAVITEPDHIAPLEPGTSVVLEGIVWNETEGGVLVVNVTWRGKTYVGTLLDLTKHNWAPPRLSCESPTSDLESRTPKGARGKRGSTTVRPGNSIGPLPIAATPTVALPLPPSAAPAPTTAVVSGGGGATPVDVSSDRRLRNGKGRRIPRGNETFQPPASPAKSDITPISQATKRKNRNSSSSQTENESEEARLKKGRSVSRGSTPNNNEYPAPPQSPVLIECPEPNCNKKYRQISGLRYHQTHAHQNGGRCEFEDNDKEEMDVDGGEECACNGHARSDGDESISKGDEPSESKKIKLESFDSNGDAGSGGDGHDPSKEDARSTSSESSKNDAKEKRSTSSLQNAGLHSSQPSQGYVQSVSNGTTVFQMSAAPIASLGGMTVVTSNNQIVGNNPVSKPMTMTTTNTVFPPVATELPKPESSKKSKSECRDRSSKTKSSRPTTSPASSQPQSQSQTQPLPSASQPQPPSSQSQPPSSSQPQPPSSQPQTPSNASNPPSSSTPSSAPKPIQPRPAEDASPKPDASGAKDKKPKKKKKDKDARSKGDDQEKEDALSTSSKSAKSPSDQVDSDERSSAPTTSSDAAKSTEGKASSPPRQDATSPTAYSDISDDSGGQGDARTTPTSLKDVDVVVSSTPGDNANSNRAYGLYSPYYPYPPGVVKGEPRNSPNRVSSPKDAPDASKGDPDAKKDASAQQPWFGYPGFYGPYSMDPNYVALLNSDPRYKEQYDKFVAQYEQMAKQQDMDGAKFKVKTTPPTTTTTDGVSKGSTKEAKLNDSSNGDAEPRKSSSLPPQRKSSIPASPSGASTPSSRSTGSPDKPKSDGERSKDAPPVPTPNSIKSEESPVPEKSKNPYQPPFMNNPYMPSYPHPIFGMNPMVGYGPQFFPGSHGRFVPPVGEPREGKGAPVVTSPSHKIHELEKVKVPSSEKQEKSVSKANSTEKSVEKPPKDYKSPPTQHLHMHTHVSYPLGMLPGPYDPFLLAQQQQQVIAASSSIPYSSRK